MTKLPNSTIYAFPDICTSENILWAKRDDSNLKIGEYEIEVWILRNIIII